MVAFPAIQVGRPLSYQALTVFPLFGPADNRADYRLYDEAIAGGTVTVEELNRDGSVPELIVNNQAETLVLFLEGEELRGAKQNRVLNASVLVAAKSRTIIPVSCVEQGRWRYTSATFAGGGHVCSSKLRHILKKTVHQSAKQGLGHRADQGKVWMEVGRQMKALGARSETGAMADTYRTHGDRLAEYRDRLPYPEGALGLAVAVGEKVVSVDLFDRPSTCARVWGRLLEGVVLDALEAGTEQGRVQEADVYSALALLQAASWQKTAAVGAGDEYRFETENGQQASALVLGDTVIHASLIGAK